MKSLTSRPIFKVCVLFAVMLIVTALFLRWTLWSRQGSDIRHVLLISIDTCRADHLGCYGYPLDTTPHIDALAAEGVVFENAFSPLPYTLPAHCTMLTGTLPSYHGIYDNPDYRLNEENVTLAELLKQEGFSTAAFVSSFVLDAQFGLEQGFDLYDDDFETTHNTVGINERRGDETTRRAVQWLENHQDEKTFAFIHYYDPHFTYEPPEPFASKFENVPPPEHVAIPIKPELFDGYTGEIAYVDDCIGQVIDKLKELNQYDSTLIIVTADHGEMLGQHGEVTHGYFIYQPAIHVPLIVKTPGASIPQRVSGSVGIVDIVPTVCALLDIDPANPMQGQDLSSCLRGNPLSRSKRVLICESLEPTKYNANSLRGLVTDQYKYIRTTRPELYDLKADPFELNNIAAQYPDRLQNMEDLLEQSLIASTRNKTAANTGVDEETRRRLASLGYVGGKVDEEIDSTGKEDPKDLIDFHIRTMQVGFLIFSEKYEQAESQCRELIAMRPTFYRSYYNMAKIALEQDKASAAITYLEKALDLKPDFADTYKALATVYEKEGQFEQALSAYRKALELEPDNVEVYHQLASCCYELGDYHAPDQYVTEALTNQPSYVDAAISLADKLLNKGQIRLAYHLYEQVLRLDHDSVTVLNALAWIQAASDLEGLANAEQALSRAQQACELSDFGTAEVVDTLAVAYAAAGQYPEAIKTAQKAIQLAQSEQNTALVQRIRGRLELYLAQKPYRDAGLAGNE